MPSALQTCARSVAVWAESAGVTRAPSASAVISGAGVRMAKLRNEWSLDLPGLRARARRGVRPVGRTNGRARPLRARTNDRPKTCPRERDPLTRIALATYSKLPTLNDDDRLLVPAFAALGVTTVPAVWDSADVCWDELQGVLIRSSWDYHLRAPEFLAWIARLERAGVTVWNPGDLLRCNHHERYLRDLSARGVATVGTRWLARGEGVDLSALPAGAGWREAVVKPAVSASAFGTWRTSTQSAIGDQSRLDELLRAGDVMVQPLLPEVAAAGEWSLLFLGRRFSHAVLKRPAPGDYRVQWEFGGSAASATPPDRLRADAEHVIAAVPGDPLYARVDGVARAGRLGLMELELIEPHLFLGWDAGAAGRLARAIRGTG